MGGTIAAMEKVYTTPLLDKLGIRPGMRVALVGELDDPEESDDGQPSFRQLLSERTTDVSDDRPRAESDVILLAADSEAELEHLATLRTRMRPNGAIWVVSRK